MVNDEYERRMEAEDEERFAEVSTPVERSARINERERERSAKGTPTRVCQTQHTREYVPPSERSSDRPSPNFC
jgi:hypothetical protein